MDGVAAGLAGRLEEARNRKVRLARGRRAESDGRFRERDVARAAVRVGIHGHGREAGRPAGADHAHGDLAAVRDEHAAEPPDFVTATSRLLRGRLRRPGRLALLEECREALPPLGRGAPLAQALDRHVRGLPERHRGDRAGQVLGLGHGFGAPQEDRVENRLAPRRRGPSPGRRGERGRPRRASSAEMRSPVTNQARARDSPILCTRYGEMTAGMTPSRTSVVPKIAFSAATTTSHTATRPVPPPSAAPWTRATIGFASSSNARKSDASSAESRRFSCIVKPETFFIQSRSAPAQNVLPAPESSMTRVVASDASSRTARCRRATISPSNAFRRAGRFRMRRAIRGSDARSRRTPDSLIASPVPIPGRSRGTVRIWSLPTRTETRATSRPATRPPPATAPPSGGQQVGARGG